MMRPIFSSSSSLLNTAALLLLCTVILPTHGFVPSSAWLQQLQRVAVTGPGATQAVAVNADYSDWYSPQRVPASPPPTRLPSQQQSINRKVSSSPSSVLQTPLTSVDDFAAFLASAGEHQLVLIKFHASWCRSCAKLGRKLDQLAHQYYHHDDDDDDEPLLKIGTVEYMAGRDICRALNIEALPTIHLYTRDTTTGAMEKVQDFTCPPSAFDQVQAYCRYYVDMARQAQQQQKQTVPLLDKSMDDEESFVQSLDRGHALMEASLQDTQKAGKLRSGWKRLFAGTSDRLRRVVNGNIDQEAAIALLD